MTFFQQVYYVVGQIPYGQVMGYGHIAMFLGHPNAARQVGRAMRYCPDDIPWYRVIRSDGSIALGMHPGFQRGLLESEGVAFLSDGRVDMSKHLFSPELAENPMCLTVDPAEHKESLT